MSLDHTRFGRHLVRGLFLTVLAIAIAEAGVCDKAREVYARGAQTINFEERAKAFQNAVDLCPSFAEAHCNLADALENLASLASGNVTRFNHLLDRAAAEYQESIRYNPKLVAAYVGLGDTYRVMGLYEKSEAAYRKALEIKPGNPRAAEGLAKITSIKSLDGEGFKNSQQIVKHFKTSSGSGRARTLMGFENRTVVKDRLRFDNILFNEWSSELKRGEAILQLEEIGKAVSMKGLSGQDFIVEGHTDNRGDYQRNMTLSGERAESVKTFLVAHYGIDPSRITTQGFGQTRPKFSNDTDEHRLKNRRVEIVFIDHRSQAGQVTR
jgi:outer membrane protein OmpA-like peptidoglycan-associated protein